MIKTEERIEDIKLEWLEKIAESMKQGEFERKRYVVGITIGNKQMPIHTINYVDEDFETNSIIGWNETPKGEIEVMRIPRKFVLYRA